MAEFPSENLSLEVLKQSWDTHLSKLPAMEVEELKLKLQDLNIITQEQASRIMQLTPDEVREIIDYVEVMAETYRNRGGNTLQYLQNILHHVVSGDIYPAAYPVAGVDAPNRPAAVTVKGLQTAEMQTISPDQTRKGETVAAVTLNEGMTLMLIKASPNPDIIKRKIQEKLDSLSDLRDKEDFKDAVISAIKSHEFIKLDPQQLADLEEYVMGL